MKGETEQEDVVSGWADSMAKILGSNKPKKKKSLILSRAQLDHQIKVPIEKHVRRKAPVKAKNEIEIVRKVDLDEEGEPKKPKLDVKVKETSLSAKQERKLELRSSKEQKEWENINRIKPTRSEAREKEIELLKIATKGVVQLFNAVNIQQKTIKNKLKEVDTSEFKKDKVLYKTKEIFDNALEKSQKLSIKKITTTKGEAVPTVTIEDDGEEVDVEIKDEVDDEETDVKPSDADANTSANANQKNRLTKSRTRNGATKRPSWQALRDDFMLDAKMKDWDQNSDSD